MGEVGGGPTEEPTLVAGLEDFERLFEPVEKGGPLAWALRDFFANGGRRAWVLRLAPVADEAEAGEAARWLGDRHGGTGLQALAGNPDFQLLCLPPTRPDLDLPPAVREAAARLCVEHRALLLVDPPAAWSDSGADGVARLRRAMELSLVEDPRARLHAALYFPRLLRSDPGPAPEAAARVPCGAVAGVVARTDERRGVWKAPAGLDARLEGVERLEVELGVQQLGALAHLGVNGLRADPDAGCLGWGSRTLAARRPAPAPSTYLPVQRLLWMIEESLCRGLGWVVLEPPDEALRWRVRESVRLFLRSLWVQGALAGSSEEKAFFVRCGTETMTAQDRAEGRLVVEVGVAPLSPGEFEILTLPAWHSPAR